MIQRSLHILLLILMVLSWTSASYAQENCEEQTTMAAPQKNMGRFEIGQCAQNYTGINYESYEFTTKLVACIEGTIRQTVIMMMTVISNQFGWLTSVLGTMVIIFFGVRVVTGERDILKRAATLSIKLAFVIIFMNMLPTVVEWVFDVFDEVLQLVAGGMSPWRRIDILIGNLVGFGPSIVLLNGLLGLIGAAAFSSSVGLLMFFFGILAILNMLSFILAMIYTYLLAFLTIGFLLTLMPVVIPLSLLFYTERYFRKWADILLSAMLTPVLIFAFVWMFLGIFDILVQNIFDLLGGNDFRAYWRLNTSLFSWIMPSDPNMNAMMQNLSTSKDLDCVQRNIVAPVQSNINPLAQNAFDAGIGHVATLNFGSNEVNIVQALSFAFASLWIFASLMKSMVGLLPQVAASIASVSSHIAFGGESMIVTGVREGLGKAQNTLTSNVANDSTKFNKAGNFAKQIGNMLGKRD